MDAIGVKRHYDVHGVHLSLRADHPRFVDAFEGLLWPFACAPSDAPVRIDLHASSAPDDPMETLPSDARLVFSHRQTRSDRAEREGVDFDVFQSNQRVMLDLGAAGHVSIDLAERTATGYLPDPDEMHVDALTSFLLFPLVELLKTFGIFSVHSGAVARHGRAVLIPGSQGRGKTTFCLTLVEGGFGFLTEDMVLLRDCDGSPEVLAFPEKVSVTDNTVRLLPRLSKHEDKLYQGMLKRHFRIDDVYPDSLIDRATPGLIVFPKVSDVATSRLEPLPASRALESLLPQGISVLDTSTSREQFALLSKLVQQSDCYRIHLGTDFSDMPALIEEAIRKAS